MDTRWLEAFVAVAEELHFGRAAARLHMAQSPLSQVIRRLEAELDEPLFARSTRAVSLTAAGSALLPHAYRVLKELRLAGDSVASAGGVLTGSLSIGFAGMYNHHTLPRLARALRRDHPGIELNLVAGIRTFDGIRLVRNGELDLAFVGLVGETDPGLESWVLSTQRLGVIVPAEHRFAGREAVGVAELRGEGFVTGPLDGNSMLTALMLRTCQAAGFTPRSVQMVSDPYLTLSLVAAGVGIAMSSSEVRSVLPPLVEWVDLAGAPIEFQHGIVWAEAGRSPQVEAAQRVIRRTFPSDTAR